MRGIIDSPDFLRRCAEVYYRGEGYVPVGVPALDNRVFYDWLRSGGWCPQWSHAHDGLWVPSWMAPILPLAASEPDRAERLVADVARVMWRPASVATVEAVLASVGRPPAWRVRHPLEVDILLTLDGPDSIRACLESRGVRVSSAP